MTRIRIMSDLHLEFGPLTLSKAGEDVLVLAGDIDLRAKGAKWAVKQSEILDVPVVMIAGNHEFYLGERDRGDMRSVYQDLHEVAEKSAGKLTFLQNEAAVVAGVRFIGATLWTDFNLHGDRALGMKAAWQGMTDYTDIRLRRDKQLTPNDTLSEHWVSREFIASELAKKVPEPVVVVTHHAPSSRSIDRIFWGSLLNAAFASNMDEFIAGNCAALWVHGHMHNSSDYVIGGTRVCVNPRGYVGHELNPEFRADHVIDV